MTMIIANGSGVRIKIMEKSLVLLSCCLLLSFGERTEFLTPR